MKDDLLWNTCDNCQKVIALEEFENGTATRKLISCDSDYSSEDYKTLHKECEEYNPSYEDEE